jgi:hypothetical protein
MTPEGEEADLKKAARDCPGGFLEYLRFIEFFLKA